jgi:hypothetical protein
VYAGLFGDDLDEVADRLDQAAQASRADQMRTTALSEPVSAAVRFPSLPSELRETPL